ncbi:hypothetical protein KC19_2G062300 [Ceratodon purpureus]|uniref:Uncharacterized protein n=1 Tax=Ceratodon purpureus TaxID=3225 RepID=A0A8T0IST5_CERPU|nr:hypothetical protein KC19_2G062300 [Ceratodon purpureus]
MSSPASLSASAATLVSSEATLAASAATFVASVATLVASPAALASAAAAAHAAFLAGLPLISTLARLCLTFSVRALGFTTGVLRSRALVAASSTVVDV